MHVVRIWILLYNVLESCRKIVMLAFFHLLCKSNGLYKLYQDALLLLGATES